MTSSSINRTGLLLILALAATISCSGDQLSPTDPSFAKSPPAPAAIRINEVESTGGSPGDWIELFNPTTAIVDLSGWQIRDSDNSHRYTFASGARINAGGYVVVQESALGFGLGVPDAVRIYDKNGTQADSYSWTTHATTTYGRCANGSGAFVNTLVPTMGSANACPAGPPPNYAWPTTDAVVTVDATNAFGTNMSGLAYEGATGGAPAVLWASRNGPGALFRLVYNGAIWTSDASNGWGAGKTLRYPNGSGSPDAEGVTFTESSAGGMYVATERNNDASSTSRNSILRFDANSAGTTMVATNEWNLTADIPAVGSNVGLEAITWIPDAYLTANNFFDSARNATYSPADYPSHGGGLFFVGVEANGIVYAYALNHAGNTFTRVATISTGMAGVMGLEFDRELNNLWATCDDGCSGKSTILNIDATEGSPTLGRFIVARTYSRPASMANLNNEGFAITPQSECVNGKKPAFWADDSGTSGHALRRGTVSC